MEPMLTLQEVKILLHLHPETVRRAVKAGKLKGAKFGRVYRFRQADVEEFIARQTAATQPIATPSPLAGSIEQTTLYTPMSEQDEAERNKK